MFNLIKLFFDLEYKININLFKLLFELEKI